MKMKNKARWVVTAGALLLVLGGALAEMSFAGVTGTLDCMGKSSIARLLGAGNALALVL